MALAYDAASLFVVPATIASGSSLSGVLQAAAGHLVAVQVPSGWTAASITFTGSADGVTQCPISDFGNTEFTVSAVAGRYHYLTPTVMARVPYLQVRSGTAGAPVTQGSNVVVLLVFAKY